MRIKYLSAARKRTKNVQKDLAVAQTDLNDSNKALMSSIQGLEPTRHAVEAAIGQNAEVEVKLDEAVKELEVVNELLRVSEARNPDGGEQPAPGNRSGEGLDSVMAHLKPSQPASHQPERPSEPT